MVKTPYIRGLHCIEILWDPFQRAIRLYNSSDYMDPLGTGLGGALDTWLSLQIRAWFCGCPHDGSPIIWCPYCYDINPASPYVCQYVFWYLTSIKGHAGFISSTERALIFETPTSSYHNSDTI